MPAIRHQDILKEDWQYLIIFDACRFDYFKKHYINYFQGKLEKRRSSGTWTLEWLEKNFTDYYANIAYISSTSFCDSRKPAKLLGHHFDPKKHFVKIYNTWNPKENTGLYVTPPDSVNKIARKAIMSHPNWRFIIHYFQPHLPTLENEKELRGKLMKSDKFYTQKKKNKSKKYFNRILNHIFGNAFIWKMSEFYGIEPMIYEEAVWREKGKNGYIDGYEENLKIVMESAKKLIEHLPPGKVVITADHGEMLGERNFFGHGEHMPRCSKLLDVPWMEVERQ